MARPIKKGLDYYPTGVTWLKSLEARRIGMKTGAQGLLIYQYLLEEIYERGYYLALEEHFVDNMIFELIPFIKDTEDNIRALINTTIDVCVEVGCFDRSLQQIGILTSKEIQRTYIEVCKGLKRRQDYNNLEYSLITGGKESKPKGMNIPEEIGVISEEIGVISEEIGVNSSESAQKKGKEIKGNNNRIIAPIIEQVYDLFKHNKLGEEVADQFYDYYDSMQWKYEDGKEVRWRHAAVNWIKNIKGANSKIINF